MCKEVQSNFYSMCMVNDADVKQKTNLDAQVALMTLQSALVHPVRMEGGTTSRVPSGSLSPKECFHY